MLVGHGVEVVFAGHEHRYERVKRQKGIPHFIVGSGGQLRRGGVTPSAMTAASFADDNAFLIATTNGAEMSFQAISLTGAVVDSGVLIDTGTWAVLAAAVAGRPLGVIAAIAVAVSIGLRLPRRITWADVIVIALATTSGFTFALFLATAALPIGAVAEQVNLGALLTVTGAAVTVRAAWMVTVWRFRAGAEKPAPR